MNRGGGGDLVSGAAAQATSSSFSQLSDTVEQKRSEASHLALGAVEKTIEQMVREALQPLLKEWLDKNLPGLVERLVAQEISKLVEKSDRL